MPPAVESMAFSGEVPWHGLGVNIPKNAAPSQILKKAELEWKVLKEPMTSVVDGTVVGIDGFFSLIRDTDKRVLGICGKEYIPTQNDQAIGFFSKFIKSGSMSFETAGSLQGGRQVWALASLNKKFSLPGNDDVAAYLLLSSPHIWGKSLIIKFTPIRVVCANTLMIAIKEDGRTKFRMPHIKSLDDEVAKQAQEVLGISSLLFESFEEKSRKLAAAKADDQIVIRYIADTLHPSLLEEVAGTVLKGKNPFERAKILTSVKSIPEIDPQQFNRSAYDTFTAYRSAPGAEMESASGTMWGALNAFTFYVDHRAGRDRDNALTAAWFGTKEISKRKAMDRALQYAEHLS